MKRRPVIIFGSSGRVGTALSKAEAELGCPVERVSWLEPKTKRARDPRDVLAQLSAIEGDADIIFASGLTDPSASAAELALANVERPLSVITATIERRRFRYLTIGSILETRSVSPTPTDTSPPNKRSGPVSRTSRLTHVSTDASCTCAVIHGMAAHRPHICSLDRCTSVCARASRSA